MTKKTRRKNLTPASTPCTGFANVLTCQIRIFPTGLSWICQHTFAPQHHLPLLSMNDYVQSLLEGKIDFEGQKQVDNIARFALIAATVISFIIGFALQSLRVTFGTFGGAVIILSLIIIPPWPAYNRHPVKWLPIIEKKASAKST
ncbi:hypothetical protein QCA50_014991 [Cerrena zonata]|uniref:Signal peptidase complex subunit 1 n=1 Tax=Cerrena zonata TaxID=2478898 RepID=A0AAW0FPH0_9APHY